MQPRHYFGALADGPILHEMPLPAFRVLLVSISRKGSFESKGSSDARHHPLAYMAGEPGLSSQVDSNVFGSSGLMICRRDTTAYLAKQRLMPRGFPISFLGYSGVTETPHAILDMLLRPLSCHPEYAVARSVSASHCGNLQRPSVSDCGGVCLVYCTCF